MKAFINLLGTRIRLNTIKKYKPLGETKIQIFYNTSRYKVEVEVFDFGNNAIQCKILRQLDLSL